MNLFEITLSNDERIIPELAVFISDSARKLGLSLKKARFLCFTMETVLEYRMKEVKEGNIRIKAEDDGQYFEFSVTDFGSPYILTSNQQAILKKKLVDRYSFEQNGRKGQCFSFSYRYDSFHPNIVKKENIELLDCNFTYRKLKDTDEDILNAITCLYDTYGYEYYHQHLYSVENFRNCMKSGSYVPIIGINSHHQTMCYCALDENAWFKGLPEFSNLVTHPIARGMGLATFIFKETEKTALSMHYEGIHVSAVAYHPYTQKMANKLGYTASAIEYEINPKGTGGYDESRRLDCVIGVKIFNKKRKHELYIDARCDEVFEMIFKDAGLNYTFHHEALNGEENLVSCYVDTDTSNVFLKVDGCAVDFEDETARILEKEEIKNSDVITVNLNMNIPDSIAGYRVLRKEGFIVTGCIPGSLNGDYMLLQKFREEPLFDKIVLEENYRKLSEKIFQLNDIEL